MVEPTGVSSKAQGSMASAMLVCVMAAFAFFSQDVTMPAAGASHVALPVLNKDGYYTVPSIEELRRRPLLEQQAVENLRVGRVGFGEIRWPGKTDVTGVNIGNVVSIEHGEVSVYADSCHVPKPPVGTKLNRPAVVKLDRIFKPSQTSEQTFHHALHASLRRAGASMVTVDFSTG